jgi:signal peptidase I
LFLKSFFYNIFISTFSFFPVNQFTKEAVDFLKDIIIILAVVLIIRTFFAMPFQINGQSMYTSYYDNQFIIVDRLSYRDFPVFGSLRDIERGDVVIFAPGVSEERKYFIKRVIGLPGETLKIKDGKVYIKDTSSGVYNEIEEAYYLSSESNKQTNVRWDEAEYIYEIPEGNYFVMGDNRNHSTDSRTCFQSCATRENYIIANDIVGKIFLDLWYFNFRDFSFTHPDLGIPTFPQFFGSKAHAQY